MSDTPSRDEPAGAAGPGGPAVAQRPRRRRGLRIALVSAASVVVVFGAVVAGGFLAFNHLASSIQRVPVSFAKVDSASAVTGAARHDHAETVLITGENVPGAGTELSGLIMLLHINANSHAGGVVSIPPKAQVMIPGHGRMQIWDALGIGGPTLLVRTVEHLTHVQINHYARIDFAHISNVVNVVGGVDVTLPETTVSFGHVFHKGVNHLNGQTALYYARQPSLTEEGRVLRQQSLIRAVLDKLANRHLLTNPVTMYRVLNALTKMLTVDSNFTNIELARLATQLDSLRSRSGTFVTAPIHTAGGRVYLDQAISRQLWASIRQDAIAAFAKKYPFTVTPVAPR